MMIRLSSTEIVTRLRNGLTSTEATIVGKSISTTFMREWDRTAPAVWVMGQSSERIDSNGAGVSGVYRQRVRVLIPIRAVVTKFSAGHVENEAELQALTDKILDIMLGWRPTGAAATLSFDSADDGPVFDNILATDIVLATECVLSKNAPVY